MTKVKFNKSMIATLVDVYAQLEEGIDLSEIIAASSYLSLLEEYSDELVAAFDDLEDLIMSGVSVDDAETATYDTILALMQAAALTYSEATQ